MIGSKRCFYCGKNYTPSRSDQMYCSKHCRTEYYKGSNPLILPIKEKWFYMLLSGVKKEEYRERKDYWETRFKKYFGWCYEQINDETGEFGWHFRTTPKEVIFRNGYRKNAPEFTAEVVIVEKTGRSEWGASPDEIYYVLQIQRIYNVRNIIEKRKNGL